MMDDTWYSLEVNGVEVANNEEVTTQKIISSLTNLTTGRDKDPFVILSRINGSFLQTLYHYEYRCFTLEFRDVGDVENTHFPDLSLDDVIGYFVGYFGGSDNWITRPAPKPKDGWTKYSLEELPVNSLEELPINSLEELPVSDEIFSQGEVTITRTIAYIEGVSYPINGITAVFVNREEFNFSTLLFGVIVLVLAGLSITGELNILAGVAWFWQVLALIIGGLMIYYVFFLRPYFLMVRTASGDTRCLESSDKEFIVSVRSAIETAVAGRG
jgi:hypothetical protein